ncbi:hypothetical protein [Nocardia asiatica]|uniref:hypothetical protein n=1 Tax=Nocardia asiatica TaxID=209252 RepID=UPI0024541BFE|nr:hypothetical protein [Nocardia asiatica]
MTPVKTLSPRQCQAQFAAGAIREASRQWGRTTLAVEQITGDTIARDAPNGKTPPGAAAGRGRVSPNERDVGFFSAIYFA